MTVNVSTLQATFEAHYGKPATGAVRAPGRVNLIGEHTDYNAGFVLPIAIEKETVALFAPREDNIVNLASTLSDETASVDLDAPISKSDPAWADYCRGVLVGLQAAGIELAGADIYFDSTVPLGGGLSSSASLEVATGLAMMGGQSSLDDMTLAKLCQKAEHDFAGTPCGIMDQAISVMGQPGHALLLDCESGQVKQIPFNDPKLVLLVADTKVKHELNDGGYAARRGQCYSAAEKLGVKMLRELTPEALDAGKDALTDVELMRARHVVGEIQRTVDAVAALDADDYHTFGDLMLASHVSLRDDYHVSCEELDAIVDLAQPQEGVYGSRMTGGGFGGCAIVLVEADKADAVSAAIVEGFEAKFGHPCVIFATHAAPGAGAVDL
jgi:galactokinase